MELATGLFHCGTNSLIYTLKQVSVESGPDELAKEPVVLVNIKKSAASTEINASHDHLEEPNGFNDTPDEGASTSRMSPSMTLKKNHEKYISTDSSGECRSMVSYF